MSKKQSIVKGRRKEPITIIMIVAFSALFAFVIGGIFLIFQTAGEYFGFSPVISVGTLPFGESGDHIVIYLTLVLFSLFVGSFFTLLLIRKYFRKV